MSAARRGVKAPGESLFALGVALLLGILVVLPVGALLYGSFRDKSPVYPDATWTLENWLALAESPFAKALWNTVALATPVALASVVVGTLLAWVASRTDAPLRRAIEVLAVMPLVLSPFILAAGWIGALSPAAGLLNAWVFDPVFGLRLNIYGYLGMAWVMTTYLAPTSYLFASTAFQSMDPTLEEAAQISGSGQFATMRRVTVPLIRPAILAALLLNFVIACEMFAIPSLLGRQSNYSNLAVLIYQKVRQIPADWGGASAAGAILFVIVAVGLYINYRLLRRSRRYVTVTGRSSVPRTTRLGAWRWPVGLLGLAYGVVALIIPLFVALLGSFRNTPDPMEFGPETFTLENYRFLLDPLSTSAVQATMTLALTVPIAVLIIALASTYVVYRTRTPGRQAINLLSTIPIAMPGVVLGVAVLWVYFPITWLPIYGTVAILFVAYFAKFLPWAFQNLGGNIVQIAPDLEEASRVAGAGSTSTYFRVTLPLLRPAIIYGWFYIYILVVREYSIAVVLSVSGSTALAPLTWQTLQQGSMGQTYALSILQILLVVIVLFVARVVFGIRLGAVRSTSGAR